MTTGQCNRFLVAARFTVLAVLSGRVLAALLMAPVRYVRSALLDVAAARQAAARHLEA